MTTIADLQARLAALNASIADAEAGTVAIGDAQTAPAPLQAMYAERRRIEARIADAQRQRRGRPSGVSFGSFR